MAIDVKIGGSGHAGAHAVIALRPTGHDDRLP